jgi:hypothetical protein
MFFSHSLKMFLEKSSGFQAEDTSMHQRYYSSKNSLRYGYH